MDALSKWFMQVIIGVGSVQVSLVGDGRSPDRCRDDEVGPGNCP